MSDGGGRDVIGFDLTQLRDFAVQPQRELIALADDAGDSEVAPDVEPIVATKERALGCVLDSAQQAQVRIEHEDGIHPARDRDTFDEFL